MNNPLRWLFPTRSTAPEIARPSETKSFNGTSFLALSGAAKAGWTQADYASLCRKGFMANPIVNRCVRLTAETASAIPMLIYENARELDSHPMLDLLKRPNAQQPGQTFMETLLGYLLVSGNAYVELVEAQAGSRELHALRPDRVKPTIGRDGWVSGYEYSVGTKRRNHSIDEAGESAVLHLKMFHPLDDHYGFPPMQAALMALDVHNSANQWNKALLDNSARPSGALVYSSKEDANLSEEQFARLKAELEEGYTGAKSAGRPLLLEGGLDWKAMGYSPRDMDFVDGRNAAARDIALAFGVPPMLLGIPGDNTYANYAEANRAFTRQTVLPLINRVLDAYSAWLQPRFGDDLKLAIDEDRVEGLSIERNAVWERMASAEFLTDAEKRQAVGYSLLKEETQ